MSSQEPAQDERPRATVVFFSMDALGHIHPILSLVKELQRRNHRAIILTTRPLSGAKRLEAMGIELAHCTPVETSPGGRSNSEEALETIMRPLMQQFRKGCVAAYEAAYRVDGAVGKHLDDMIKNHHLIEAKLESLKPDLIVYDHVIGIPCITRAAKRWVRVYSGFPIALHSSLNDSCVAGLGLSALRNEMTGEWKEFERRNKRPLRQKIREFWHSKGAPDWPLELDLTPTSPYLNFYLGPRELGLEQVAGSLPESSWFRLEHTIDEAQEAGGQDLSPKLGEEFLSQPGKLVYFSLGTLVTCDTEMINRLLEILGNSPNKFIVSMGQMHRHIKLRPNMWGEQFVDQKAVLKRVDLFITHGGHNSIIEAFYYGVPGLIVLPVFADQFDSAQRVQDCGFGRRLNAYTCKPDELLEAIESILADTKLAERMREASARLKGIKYHEIAVDKLERLINDI